MTTTADAREIAIQVIQAMPDGVSLDDIVYELYFRQHMDEGLRDIDEGRTVPHEEVMKMVAEWLRPVGR